MIYAAYGPVSDIEVVWTVVAFAGLVYSLLNVRDASLDLRVVDELGYTNGRRTLARYQLEAEVLRSIVQSIFLAIGLAAMALPEVPDRLDLPTAQIVIGALVTYGLILSSVLLTVKSYLGYKVRRVLLQGQSDHRKGVHH